MNLKTRLDEAMKEAMRARESVRLNAIRMIRAAVKNREIEDRREYEDQDIVGVLSTLVKQRKESIDVYRGAGRTELAEKEEQELAVIQSFLPVPLTEAELKSLIEEAVAELGASSVKDMGRVMKLVTAKTVGRADGRLVSDLVKARLSA